MSTEDILAKLRHSYVTGIPSHLEEMENLVLNIENRHEFKENFDALYRKAHSLKGSGATYDFPIITTVCHQLEDFLTDEFQKEDEINPSKINTAFAYIDVLKDVHTLLITDDDNFLPIDNQLKQLKKQNPKLRAMLIDPPEKMYRAICIQSLENANVHCTTTPSGVTALQRLLNENFDLLITPRENPELSGMALIAALKINKRYNVNIQSIMITSNPRIELPTNLGPSYIVLKGLDFAEKLDTAIKNIITDKQAMP